MFTLGHAAHMQVIDEIIESYLRNIYVKQGKNNRAGSNKRAARKKNIKK